MTALNIANYRPTTAADIVISADLIEASYRSETFPADWTQEEREKSLMRYRRWLFVKYRHPNARLAPTRDIDLFWHLHMLAPVAYNRDCDGLFGRLLDHDGGFGLGPGEQPILQQVFTETAELYEQEFGEPYREDGLPIGEAMTNCWHDCQNRCWHACSSVE